MKINLFYTLKIWNIILISGFSCSFQNMIQFTMLNQNANLNIFDKKTGFAFRNIKSNSENTM